MNQKIIVSFNKHRCPGCGKELNEREIKLKKCTQCKCNIRFTHPITPILSGTIIIGLLIGLFRDKEAVSVIASGVLLCFVISCIVGGFKLYARFIRECVQWTFGTGKYSNPKDKKWFK